MYTEWISQLAVEGVSDKEVLDPAQALEMEMLSRQKAMVEGIARGGSDVQGYYDNATVFVTGGSGFLGKQLVEKLFRACNIKRVYLLLRPKKGMNVQERVKEILEDPVYSGLLEQKPSFADRIVVLQGDVSDIRLGLSNEDWSTVVGEVDMIFHVAATTRFDEGLQLATLINVRGTREALRLGKQCTKLKSFVYVSTAYSHATSDKIGQPVFERFYPSPISPAQLINMAESTDGRILNKMAPILTTGWPNTYTFAKAVAEEQVRLTAAGMPVCIVRPSIGSGLGLIHVMQTTSSTDLSLVPVDYVNNAIIAAGWEVGARANDVSASGASETTIYNVVMSQENKLTWESLRSHYMSIRTELPMPYAVYLAYVFCVQSYYAFLLLTVLLHFVPAYIMDLVLLVLRKERRFVQIYKKIYKLSIALSYFLNTTYYLDGTNTDKLYEKLSVIDKKIFFFNMKTIDWFEYSKVWCIGVRKYIIKDGLKNTEYAKRKQFWFQYVNYVVLSVYMCVIWFLVSGSFEVLARIFYLW